MAPGSSVLLDEYFETSDPRFLGEVLASTSAGKLKALAPKWIADRRPFAREALLAYVDEGCDRPFHRPLVKAIFKLAEGAGDAELLGHLLVAFDRLKQRRLVKRTQWDWQARGLVETQVLEPATDAPAAAPSVERTKKVPSKEMPRFSLRTRDYLRRRAWRWFRRLAKVDEKAYAQAIRGTLALYEDEHLSKPEHLLDAWGLVHALYWGSPVLERKPTGVVVAPGQSLRDLAPAPYAPNAWRGCAEDVLGLVVNAKSHTVRTFAIGWLRAHEKAAFSGIPVMRLVPLLRSPHEEVQLFGGLLLADATGLEALRVVEWMELLKVENSSVVAAIARMAAKYVRPERFELAQLVELALLPLAPSAELGLKWLKARKIDKESDYLSLFALANARAPSVRAEACEWLGELIAFAPWAKAVHVRELLDARHVEARKPALELFAKLGKYRDDVLIWGALSESPYDDVRAVLVSHLTDRQKVLSPESMRAVWATTLLALHRGGRAKLKALSQLGARLVKSPEEADELLPLVNVALRSVRAPERRSAIAALAVAGADPRVAQAIATHIPDLRVGAEVSA